MISPFAPPQNTSGMFMMLRNTRAVTRLWRKSHDVERLLSSLAYLVFNEWWGTEVPIAALEPIAKHCCADS